MKRETLHHVAVRYVEIIESIEKTVDKEKLAQLEEQRVIWHNKFIEKLKREGIAFKDREHVTRIAYRIVMREL